MLANLQKLNPELQIKASKPETLMAKLKVDREKVNEAHRQISKEEEIVKAVCEEAKAHSKYTKVNLYEVISLLHAALAVVEDLKTHKADLAVVKTFVKPLQLKVEVMNAVCLVCGKSGDMVSAKLLFAQISSADI